MDKSGGVVVFPTRQLVMALCASLCRMAAVLALIASAAVGGQARRALAHAEVPPSGEAAALVGFDQRLGEQAPLDLPLLNEAGQPVRLGDYFTGQPVILALTYFECANLCPLVREGLATALAEVSLRAGQDYTVVVVSIDPAETGAMAAAAKAETLA
ncbi:MAG TPA: SCO family protein, partial [Caldilineaceae bacterium]|nr:SCO family protein [Caldilineaceae bacterium]